MRKMICIALAVLLVFLLSACSFRNNGYIHAVEFYYLRSELVYGQPDGVIASETREAGQGTDLTRILRLYMQGPLNEELLTPFPAGTSIENVISKDGSLTIILGENFASLKGIAMSKACICLASTCFAISDVKSVSIIVPGKLLEGAKAITLTRNDIHLIDEGASFVGPINE